MSEATHPTTKPEQVQTDTFAVFADARHDPASNLVLIKRVEVPRYSVPNDNGVELSKAKRTSLAVTFAVTASDTTPDPAMVEGSEFLVLSDIEAPMAHVPFERNPAVAGCWNPNEESVAEFAGVNDE